MRRKQLKIPMTPEFLRSRAQRDASGIGRFGWRPSRQDLENLRASTRDAIAYRKMLRAWRSVGFSTAAIRRLAERKPELRERNLPPEPAQTSLAATHDHHTTR
jgi:DNA-binding transcriptional MerR regulator